MKTSSPDREAKRQRFVQGKAQAAARAGRPTSRRKLWVGLTAIALVVIVAGSLSLVGQRAATPASVSAASVPATGVPVAEGEADVQTATQILGATPILGAAPVAATHNHEPYPEVVAEDGEIRLEAAQFADGVARHYTYMADGKPIEFFVLLAADGTLRTAYNACDVCFSAKLGYTQDGDVMVCNNCGRRFPAKQIGREQGGCNPSPLPSQSAGGLVILRTTDLAAGARLF